MFQYAAGLALAMCAPKFHLFLLAPLLLIGRRRMTLALAASVRRILPALRSRVTMQTLRL